MKMLSEVLTRNDIAKVSDRTLAANDLAISAVRLCVLSDDFAAAFESNIVFEDAE